MDWQKLVSIVIDELNKRPGGHFCIQAACVLLSVLRTKGIKGAYPLAVKVRIFNPKFTERLKIEPPPNTPELEAQWKAEGCIGIIIGGKDAPAGDWPGHLVVIIPGGLKGKDALCDLTITQANKPEWNIQLGPILISVRESHLRGKEALGVPLNGCQIIYEAFPDDQSFKETPVWKGKLKRDLIVKRVLKRLPDQNASV